MPAGSEQVKETGAGGRVLKSFAYAGSNGTGDCHRPLKIAARRPCHKGPRHERIPITSRWSMPTKVATLLGAIDRYSKWTGKPKPGWWEGTLMAQLNGKVSEAKINENKVRPLGTKKEVTPK